MNDAKTLSRPLLDAVREQLKLRLPQPSYGYGQQPLKIELAELADTAAALRTYLEAERLWSQLPDAPNQYA